MKKLLNLSLAILLLNISITFASTPNEDINAIKRVRSVAEAYFENHQYGEALELYLQLEGKTIDKGVINYMIGMCYLSSENKDKALDYLNSAKESQETSFVINYYLGKVYFDAGHYTKALSYLSVYLKELNSIDGLTFKPYRNIPKEHLIHYQKSPRDVNQMMDNCSTSLRNQM